VSAPLHIAILAAGSAVRFGGGKLDSIVAGRPLGRFALESALALHAGRPSIIVGVPPPAFARLAAEAGVADLVVNADAQHGLATSVATAARAAAAARSKYLLLMLADMPLVAPDTLRRLVEAAGAGQPAAARHADGNAGIPACFSSDHFAALQDLRGDRGAGALLRQAKDITVIAVAAAELCDVDMAEDLARLEALLAPGR
jgi:molybdenum cofactor cytidylyltransferase